MYMTVYICTLCKLIIKGAVYGTTKGWVCSKCNDKLDNGDKTIPQER